MATTATAKMTILYTDEIPQVGHTQFDKPRRYPIIFKDGLWTAFVLCGTKGQRATFGYLVEIKRDTLHDLEVVLHDKHDTIVGRVAPHMHNLVIDDADQMDHLKLCFPAHHDQSLFYI
jgi:hypothetical protein